MIVELLVGTGLVLAGAAAARVVLRRRRQVEREEGGLDTSDEERDDERSEEEDEREPKKRRKKKRRRRHAPEHAGPRGLRVGDVLLYADTELWLAGSIELDEEGFVARLFPSPGSSRGAWVAQLDEEASDLAVLDPTEEVPAGPVPERLPIGGRRLSLERRGQADVRTDGESLPRTSPRGSYCILSDAGGRILVVVDFDKAPRLALVGDRLGRHMVDLLPGGDLED